VLSPEGGEIDVMNVTDREKPSGAVYLACSQGALIAPRSVGQYGCPRAEP